MNGYRDPYDDNPEGGPAPKKKRPRGRFSLSPSGIVAVEAYRKSVTAAQAGAGGRHALEESQEAWAQSHGVSSRDALILGELAAAPRSVVELFQALADCGMPKTAIEAGIDRLTVLGLVEPPPAHNP